MKLQLKRSNVIESGAAKLPTSAQLEYGELAINYNQEDPAIFLKDSNNNVIRISGVGSISDDGQVELPASTTPPANPLSGNLWFNSDDGRLYIYYTDADSSQWVDASPDSWDPSSYPDLTDPTKQPNTLDDRYVMDDGDNMTGNLTLGTDKITLDATNGFINCEGWATFGNGTINNSKFLVLGSAGAALQIENDAGDNTVQIQQDGAAEFASYVSADTFFWSKNTDSVNAGLYLYNYDGNPNRADAAFAVSPTNGSTAHTVTIDYDGKATFEGTVRSNGGTATNYAFLATGDVNNAKGIGVFNAGGVNVAEINLDGSATFANFVQSGSVNAGGGGGNYLSFGEVAAYAPNGTSPVFRGWNAGTGGANALGVSILANGTASFAGSVGVNRGVNDDSAAFVVSNSTGVVSRLNCNGSSQFNARLTAGVSTLADRAIVAANNTSTGNGGTITAFQYNGSGEVWNGFNVGNQTSTIWADGSALFLNNLQAGSTTANTSSNAFYNNSDTLPALYCRNYGDDRGLMIEAKASSCALEIRNTSSQVAASLYGNGNATFAGTVTATVVPPSDARFKENIEPAKPQLADVVALGGILKNYDWNEDAPVNDELRAQRQLGLIAQEVEAICPTLTKDIARTKTLEVTPAVIGPKGKVITEAVTEEVDDGYKGISTDALIMKLLGAVTELSAKVEALENKE